jgi:diguanylate cyclase (GGDEF)-like protein
MSDTLSKQRLLAIIATQNQIASSSLELQRVMDLVVEQAKQLVGAAAAVVELIEGDEMVYRAVSGTAVEHAGMRLSAAASMSGLAVATGQTLYCSNAASDDRVDRAACERVGATSMVCVPLLHASAVVGVLKAYDPRINAFAEDDLVALELLSGVIASHMAHANDYQEQEHASIHDALTGLPNRRAFDRRIAAEGARARRYGDTSAICSLDLDGFKQVNDTVGHTAGDAVLRAVAQHFDILRGEDEAYRVGGDEFAMVLVGATIDGAELVARRIQAAIAIDPTCRGVTISCGTAELDATDPLGSVEAADAELYAAKALRAEVAARDRADADERGL